MQFARVVKTSEIVEASKNLRRKHGFSGYQCPTCGSRVFLRAGDLREPHFAHFQNEGSRECEDYHPGFGGGGTTTHDHGARPEVEDSENEAGLCLEDLEKDWTLYLRLPEIPNEELGPVSLSTLQSACVEVCAGNAPPEVIPAFDLRPGVGSARVRVIPTSDQYLTAPRGRWPAGVYKNRWQLSSAGLIQIGTLFRFSRGEWVRLRPRSLVEWGENLYVVAHSTALPPQTCSPTPVRKLQASGSTWTLWRILLPRDRIVAVERWLESLGHQASMPASRVKILSIPDTFDAETRLPYFTRGTPIVAKVVTPYAGATALLALYYESNKFSVSARSDSESRDVFFEISLSTPGEYSLEVDSEHETHAEFNYSNQPKISDIRRSLSQLPRLCLSIGETRFEAWSDQSTTVAIDTLKTSPEVSIDLGVERFWIDLSYISGDERVVRVQLSRREAERAINEVLSKKRPGNLRVDAGALGSINLSLLLIEKEDQSRPESRIAPWLACVSAARPEGKSPSMNPAVFRGAAGNTRLMFASMQNVKPALAAQIRSIAKRQALVNRRHKG